MRDKRNHAYSRASDAMWIYGFHAVREQLSMRPERAEFLVLAGRHPGHKVLIALAKEHGIPYAHHLEKIPPDLRNRKNAVAFLRVAAWSYATALEVLEEIHSDSIYLILDHLQDPTNLGNILRTATAVGVQAVFLPKHRSVRLTPVVARIASGALAYVKLVRFGSLQNLIRLLQQRGIWVITADPYAPRLWYEMEAKRPVAILIGHEGKGVGRMAVQLSDQVIQIPMVHLESLNAAASVAVLLYEIVRQRSVDAKEER